MLFKANEILQNLFTRRNTLGTTKFNKCDLYSISTDLCHKSQSQEKTLQSIFTQSEQTKILYTNSFNVLYAF